MIKPFEFKLRNAENQADLEGILSLQRENTVEQLPEKDLTNEGFVTVKHSLELLAKMNTDYKHIISVDNSNKVIAYALIMLKKFRAQIPVLIPMFQMIDDLQFNGSPLARAQYLIMGQICIQKAYRGKGLFRLLYQALVSQMKQDFDYTITEVDTANIRSLNAHIHIGFQNIHSYQGKDGIKWAILLYENKKIIP